MRAELGRILEDPQDEADETDKAQQVTIVNSYLESKGIEDKEEIDNKVDDLEMEVVKTNNLLKNLKETWNVEEKKNKKSEDTFEAKFAFKEAEKLLK